MSKKPERTGKISTDERGRSVWTETVITGQFDLVSTAELRAVLEAADDAQVSGIAKAAETAGDGVVAREASTGMFRVIDERELQALLAADRIGKGAGHDAETIIEAARGPEDSQSLSLVSTQMLKRMLGEASREESPADDEPLSVDNGGGFDPYNTR